MVKVVIVLFVFICCMICFSSVVLSLFFSNFSVCPVLFALSVYFYISGVCRSIYLSEPVYNVVFETATACQLVWGLPHHSLKTNGGLELTVFIMVGLLSFLTYLPSPFSLYLHCFVIRFCLNGIASFSLCCKIRTLQICQLYS